MDLKRTRKHGGKLAAALLVGSIAFAPAVALADQPEMPGRTGSGEIEVTVIQPIPFPGGNLVGTADVTKGAPANGKLPQTGDLLTGLAVAGGAAAVASGGVALVAALKNRDDDEEEAEARR